MILIFFISCINLKTNLIKSVSIKAIIPYASPLKFHLRKARSSPCSFDNVKTTIRIE
jgi:hypothetical protein